MKKKAFTLIELLVVITIIALLVSILMPALSRAKEQAKITLCSSNLRQQSLAIKMYANANDGNVPIYGSGAWLWDLAYETTRMMNKYAGIKTNEIYVCPSNPERVYNDRRWWQFGTYPGDANPEPLLDEDTLTVQQRQGTIRVMPYVYMFKKNGLPAIIGTKTPREADWITNLDKVKFPADKPMIVDAIIESATTPELYFAIGGGGLGQYIKDSTNHKSRSRGPQGTLPSGANHYYADGHGVWVAFNETEMQASQNNNSPKFHWKY